MARVLLAGVLVLAASVLLLGWGAGIEAFRRGLPGLPAMVPSTASCLVLLAGGHLLVLTRGPPMRIPVGAVTTAVSGFAIWQVSQGIGADLPPPGADAMSVATSGGIVLSGAAILARLYQGPAGGWPVYIASTGLILALFALDGFVADPAAFPRLPTYTGLAPHTALAISALFLALLLDGPRHSWLPTILGPGQGAAQARRILPLVVIGPTCLTFLAAGLIERDLIESSLYLSSLAAVLVAAGAFVVTRNARYQNDAEAQAAINEARLKQVLNGLETAVFVFGADRSLRLTNRKADRICGGADKAQDWLFSTVFHSLQDRRPLSVEQNPAARLLADPAPGDLYAGYVDADRVERALRFTTRHRVDLASGRDLTILSVVDETDSWKMRAFLAQQERLDLVAQLAGGIAHDIANILGTIRLAADTGRLHEDPARIRRSFAMIQKACDRGAWLTERLTRMTRVTDPAAATFDARSTVADALLLARRSIPAPVRLDQALSPEPCPVTCDPSDLESAVLNLVLNAQAAFADAGRTAGQIRVTLSQADGQVRLVVADNGPGMPPQVLDRATEAFFSTRKGGGSGLGLAMIATFAARAGGDFAIQSTEGDGTTATLTLPRAAEPAPPDASLRAAPDGVPDLAGLRLLVVEDDPQFHDLLVEAISMAGAEVMTAMDFDGARAILDGDAVLDMMLTDVILPGPKGGLELADAAGTLRPRLPVVFLSGFAAGKSVEAMERQGVFLRKPVNLELLANTIRLLLPREA